MQKKIEQTESRILTPGQKQHLADKGYVVVPNVLSNDEVEIALGMFKGWQATIPNHHTIHRKCDPHGIYKHHQAGHQEHAWYIRTRPKVKQVFSEIWDTKELVVSFDGSCWIPKDFKGKDNFWCHSDQAPKDKGLTCYQGVIGLTDNKQRTLVVWEGTHTIHYEYFKKLGREKQSGAWQRIPNEDEEKLKPLRRVLHIPAGAIAIWDSRTFHQNQYGPLNCEERYAQYVCMLPKNNIKNSPTIQAKRLKYFKEKRTTSHWPYPLKVNGLQPRTWGDKSLRINYDELREPNLEPYMETIKTLI